MDAANVGGAFLGAVFGELLKIVTDALRQSLMFKSKLQKLKSTLDSVTPKLQEIEQLNKGLDLPEEETEKLRKELNKGKELIRKCLKVKSYDLIKSHKYAGKLIKLNRSIEDFCAVNLQLQIARDGKMVLVGVNSIARLLSGNQKGFGVGVGSGVFSGFRIDKPCSVPDAPEITPGLDVPLKELKIMLLKDDGHQVIVVSAPPGAGKTTLVKKICADPQVKGTMILFCCFVLIGIYICQ